MFALQVAIHDSNTCLRLRKVTTYIGEAPILDQDPINNLEGTIILIELRLDSDKSGD